jgi:hypothetical protein
MSDLTPEALAALSEAAEPSPWRADGPHICDAAGYWFASFDEEATAPYVVALVELHRAGKLAHVDAKGNRHE